MTKPGCVKTSRNTVAVPGFTRLNKKPHTQQNNNSDIQTLCFPLQEQNTCLNTFTCDSRATTSTHSAEVTRRRTRRRTWGRRSSVRTARTHPRQSPAAAAAAAAGGSLLSWSGLQISPVGRGGGHPAEKSRAGRTTERRPISLWTGRHW